MPGRPATSRPCQVNINRIKPFILRVTRNKTDLLVVICCPSLACPEYLYTSFCTTPCTFKKDVLQLGVFALVKPRNQIQRTIMWKCNVPRQDLSSQIAWQPRTARYSLQRFTFVTSFCIRYLIIFKPAGSSLFSSGCYSDWNLYAISVLFLNIRTSALSVVEIWLQSSHYTKFHYYAMCLEATRILTQWKGWDYSIIA